MLKHYSAPLTRAEQSSRPGEGTASLARLAPQQVRVLHTIHVAFADTLAEVLRSHAGPVTVSLVSLEETTAAQYRRQYPTPAWSADFSALEPHAGAFECSSELAHLLVDLLLQCGGAIVHEADALGELAEHLLQELFTPVLLHYGDGWQRQAALVLTSDERPLALSPDEAVFAAGYAITGEHGGGELHLLLRLAAWRRALPTQAAAPTPAPVSEPANLTMLNVLGSCQLPVRALLGRTTISVQDLLALQAGDILCLEARPDDPIEIHVGNHPKLCGHAHLEDSRYVITIDEPVS